MYIMLIDVMTVVTDALVSELKWRTKERRLPHLTGRFQYRDYLNEAPLFTVCLLY